MLSNARRHEPIGVIGTGLMGTALAERLLEHGYPVVVYNRTRSKADRLIDAGARWADDPLRECDRVMISLYTTEIVEQVLMRMDSSLRSRTVLVDTTTGDPRQTESLGERLHRRGVRYLEAPFSGSSQQTRQGEATAIVGGPAETLEACRDLFDCLAAKTHHVGPWGSGARMKLVTNLVLGLNRAALAEGLTFASSTGLDPGETLKVLIDSAAYSRAMDVKGPKMVKGEFSPAAKLSQHLKDVRLILDEGASCGADLPLSKLHCRLLRQVEAMGFGQQDNSAIIHAFQRPSVRRRG